MFPLYTAWVFGVNPKPRHNDPMDTCNAVQKFGARTAICDLPHGHTGLHRATVIPGTTAEWKDEQW
jgi:hypothetical protein